MALDKDWVSKAVSIIDLQSSSSYTICRLIFRYLWTPTPLCPLQQRHDKWNVIWHYRHYVHDRGENNWLQILTFHTYLTNDIKETALYYSCLRWLRWSDACGSCLTSLCPFPGISRSERYLLSNTFFKCPVSYMRFNCSRERSAWTLEIINDRVLCFTTIMATDQSDAHLYSKLFELIRQKYFFHRLAKVIEIYFVRILWHKFH